MPLKSVMIWSTVVTMIGICPVMMNYKSFITTELLLEIGARQTIHIGPLQNGMPSIRISMHLQSLRQFQTQILATKMMCHNILTITLESTPKSLSSLIFNFFTPDP